MDPYICNAEVAEKIHDWLLNRGGIFIWRSINLSNPGASWTSPARDSEGKATTKPTWQSGDQPERHIVNIDDVSVATTREVKSFHVATRMGGSMNIKVTDGGSRKIRSEVEKAEKKHGKPAHYVFDYGSYENAVIVIDDETIPMSEWIKKRDQVMAS